MTQDTAEQSPPDPVELAFEAMGNRLAGVVAAIDGFAARQQELHARDYTEDLARLNGTCDRICSAIVSLGKRPAVALTPDEIGRQIAVAGDTVRHQDHAAWQGSVRDLRTVIGKVDGLVQRGVNADRQLRWGIGIAVAAFVLGCFVGDVIPARIDQMMPEGWRWPEQRAAGDLNLTMRAAGQRLLKVASQEGWQDVDIATLSSQGRIRERSVNEGKQGTSSRRMIAAVAAQGREKRH